MRTLLILAFLCLSALADAQTVSIHPGITVTGKVVPFDSTKHTLTYCNIADWDSPPLCLIDGKPFFGSDLDRNAPRDYFEYLYLTIDSVNIPLDVSCMFNVSFDGILNLGQIDGGWCMGGYEFIGYFEEGDAAYIARWLIREGASIRTHLYRSEPVIEPAPVQAQPTMLK